MKNKNILILILTAFLLSGCSLITSKNTYIQIYNCEHGSINVQLTEKSLNGIDFILLVNPENGYYLKSENLYVYNDNPNSRNGYADYYPNDKNRIILTNTVNQNIYTFKADNESKIVINALFTKIE